MLVLLQFDAAPGSLVARMIDEGRLPALAALHAQGRWSGLEADSNLFEAATYPTLYTGVGVGEHGLYYPLVWSAEAQRLRYMDRFPRPETVWERLGRSGRRSLVIDPYQLWVTEAVPGICLSGWQVRHNFIPQWATPRRAHRELVRRFGRAPRLDDVAGERTLKGLLRKRRHLLAAARRAADATVHLLWEEPYDFVWVTFIGAHLAGHLLWDLSCVGSDGSVEDRSLLETALEDVYVEVDRAIGRIVEALPDAADVIVFSSLGMGPQTSRSDLLPEMVQAVLDNGSGMSTGPNERDGAGGSIWKFRAAFPAGLRAAVARLLPGDAIRELVARLYLRDIDWSRTPAFTLPGDHYGHIRLNVRGRERRGCLAPQDADGLLDLICEGLMTFEDVGGGPSIEEIVRPREPASGPKWEMMPDLVVRWSARPSTTLKGVRSPRFGEVRRRNLGTGRSGNHAPGAWLLLVPSRAGVVPRPGAPRIVDIAATACALLEGDPEGLAGSPLMDVRSSS